MRNVRCDVSYDKKQTVSGGTIVVKSKGEIKPPLPSYVAARTLIIYHLWGRKKGSPAHIFRALPSVHCDICDIDARACKESNTGKGPVTIRTPYGLGVEEWEAGLEKYAMAYQALDGIDNYDIKRK